MLNSVHDVMEEVRGRTLRLVEHLDEEQRNAVLSPIMSPLSWDLGHVAAYEDLWLNHRAAGRPLLREDLAALYDAFETPRTVRGDLEFLRGAELREYMDAVRERALEAPVSELHELVIRHELQHTETMLQAMRLGDVMPPSFAGPRAVTGTGLEMVEVAEGPVEIGSAPGGLRVRQRAAAPHGVDGAVHDRPHAGHERHLADVRRGRRLRAARVVVRRGLGVERGVRHHPPRGGRGRGT